MPPSPTAPSVGMAALEALRARGADRADPVRFRFIEAMVRRTQAQRGTARHLLEARVLALLAAFEPAGRAADGLASAEAKPSATSPALDCEGAAPASPSAAACSPLAGLARQLATRADHHAPSASGDTQAGPAARREPQSLQYFRSTWARLDAQRRLAQSLEQLPGNAGPLNSHRLVHRALTMMRELSPEYLQHFMAHVDALMWLDQAQAGATAPRKDTPRARTTKKPRVKPG